MEGQSGFDWHLQSPGVRSDPPRTLNLDGDRQADLSVHGGPDKAVYVSSGMSALDRTPNVFGLKSDALGARPLIFPVFSKRVF
jgi:hypothetical protein